MRYLAMTLALSACGGIVPMDVVDPDAGSQDYGCAYQTPRTESECQAFYDYCMRGWSPDGGPGETSACMQQCGNDCLNQTTEPRDQCYDECGVTCTAEALAADEKAYGAQEAKCATNRTSCEQCVGYDGGYL